MGHKDKLNGKLTVTTVVSFGTTWLTPRIKEFMDLHPEIEIELIFDDKELDLSTRRGRCRYKNEKTKTIKFNSKKIC